MLKQLSFVWLTQVFDQSSLTLSNFESGAWAYNKLCVIAKLPSWDKLGQNKMSPSHQTPTLSCNVVLCNVYKNTSIIVIYLDILIDIFQQERQEMCFLDLQ